MKTAQQLFDELQPFIKRQRNSCFSEIESLLNEISDYLAGQAYADQGAPAPPEATPPHPIEKALHHLKEIRKLLRENPNASQTKSDGADRSR